MFIRSLLWSKDIGYVKVSSLELKTLYIWPYWAQGRIQGVLNKYLPLIDLMFLSLTLRKMIIISQMIMRKKARPCYKGWVHTTCPVLGSPHYYSPISCSALPALHFLPEMRSLNKILLRTSSKCGAGTIDPRQMDEHQTSALIHHQKINMWKHVKGRLPHPPHPGPGR